MAKVAVLLKEGFEETEAITAVDIIRRARIECDMISMMEELTVLSSHQVKVVADKMYDGNLDEYDMIVCPGGVKGSNLLKADERVIKHVKEFAADPNKWVAAICAGPIVLAKADVVRGKKATCHPTEEFMNQLKEAGAIFEEDVVAKDDHMITARGAGATLAFGYAIVEALGAESMPIKKAMVYDLVKASQY